MGRIPCRLPLRLSLNRCPLGTHCSLLNQEEKRETPVNTEYTKPNWRHPGSGCNILRRRDEKRKMRWWWSERWSHYEGDRMNRACYARDCRVVCARFGAPMPFGAKARALGVLEVGLVTVPTGAARQLFERTTRCKEARLRVLAVLHTLCTSLIGPGAGVARCAECVTRWTIVAARARLRVLRGSRAQFTRRAQTRALRA